MGKIVWTSTAAEDQLKFCARYLVDHGINTSTKFMKLVEMLTPDDPEYGFVKINKRDEWFEEMAVQLRNLWPAGSKRIEGQLYPWRDSVANLVVRLKRMWNEREFADKYKIEDVLSAARQYLSQFETDTTYMQTLPYFIWKQDTKSVGKALHKSRLADMLEGRISEDNKSDWDLILENLPQDEGRIV